jgi:hypothetical protein
MTFPSPADVKTMRLVEVPEFQIWMTSAYVPACTRSESPGAAALTARLIVRKGFDFVPGFASEPVFETW